MDKRPGRLRRIAAMVDGYYPMRKIMTLPLGLNRGWAFATPALAMDKLS